MSKALSRFGVAVLACLSVAPALGAELGKMAAADLARIKARTICSCVFVQRMPLAQCTDGGSEIWRYASDSDAPPLFTQSDQRLDVSLDSGKSLVRLLAGERVLAASQYFADGGGCVTLAEGDKVSSDSSVTQSPSARRLSAPLPRGSLPQGVSAQSIRNHLDEGFSASGPLRGLSRAALVVSGGRVVADRYAAGFDASNLFYTGSIAKVLNNLLAGLLVRDGRLRVEDTVNMPQWRGDDRRRITYDHLLKMVSGIQWDEEFWRPGEPGYEVFFGGSHSLDVVRYMTERKLEAKPGTHFEYSTGSAILLGAVLQAKLATPTRAGLLEYLDRELFAPIGARQAVIEFDKAEHPLTGHAMPIGAEDLARFGMLLLEDGRWEGRRVLPAGWVAYSTRPALEAEPTYGAQLMLNAFGVPGCFGHSGVGENRLLVCPDRDLVVVWLSSMFNFTGSIPDDGSAEMVRKIALEFPKRSGGAVSSGHE